MATKMTKKVTTKAKTGNIADIKETKETVKAAVKEVAAETKKVAEKAASETKKAAEKAASETKKAAEKATSETKKAVKKAATKKEVKTSVTVQCFGKEMDDKAMIAAVKKAWTKAGHKVGDIRTIDLYVKPEEASVYYVINGSEAERIDF